MAAGDTDIGTGSTLTFASFTPEILSLAWSGISRESVDTSHMGTVGARTFMPGDLYDPGELTAEVHLDTTEAPPITGATTALTVTFPDAETWSANAFMTGFEFNDPLEDKMTGTATFKFADDVTF